jgi:hypothetical protein
MGALGQTVSHGHPEERAHDDRGDVDQGAQAREVDVHRASLGPQFTRAGQPQPARRADGSDKIYPLGLVGER